MSIRVEIPDPLAGQVAQAAKSEGKSPEDVILEAVAQKLAGESLALSSRENGASSNPLLGLLADDPELADFLSQNAYAMRAALPMRTSRE